MNAPRKVFVASKSTQDAINDTFQWPEGFERTTELDDAEFIVLDLVNLPFDWLGYPWTKQAIYVPKQNLPILFVALEDKIAPQFDDIKNLFKSVDLPVYRSAEELFNALQWLQSIFPFYNQTKTPDIDKAAAYAALAHQRGR
jgi:hypothetical protein